MDKERQLQEALSKELGREGKIKLAIEHRPPFTVWIVQLENGEELLVILDKKARIVSRNRPQDDILLDITWNINVQEKRKTKDILDYDGCYSWTCPYCNRSQQWSDYDEEDREYVEQKLFVHAPDCPVIRKVEPE